MAIDFTLLTWNKIYPLISVLHCQSFPVHREGFSDPLPVEKLMLRDCPCSIKTREVLWNPSPLPSRFPSTLEISLGLRPREISWVSGNLGRRGWIFQSLPPLGGARIHSTWAPMSDIFFLGPHDITRYFGFWYDNHTILHDISHLVKYARKSQKLRHFREIREKTVQYTKFHSSNV